MNVFPVTVKAPDGTSRHTDCRMIFDGTHTTVWAWPSGAPKPAPVLTIDGSPEIGPDGKTFTFETGDGPVTVVQADGCGCAAKLKNYTPTSARPSRVFTDG